jgi:hypothetical protein
MARKTQQALKSKSKKGLAAVAARQALSIAMDKKWSIAKRIAALAQATPLLARSEKHLESLLGVLRDEREPVAVRLAALQTIQATSFDISSFAGVRGDYLLTLRKIAQDENQDIRQRALGALAREKDGFAQKKLLEGLQDPQKALVSPEKALQLLSYDPHAGAYDVARSIVDKPPNPTAKREALRLLAADPSAAPIFEKTLLDKNELRENRQISAAALHGIAPDKFQDLSRQIVLDSKDFDDIKASTLTALSQFGDPTKLTADSSLQDTADQLKNKGSSKLRSSAVQFLSKYGR